MAKFKPGDKVKVRELTKEEINKMTKINKKVLENIIKEAGTIYTIKNILREDENFVIYEVEEKEYGFQLEKLLLPYSNYKTIFNDLDRSEK